MKNISVKFEYGTITYDKKILPTIISFKEEQEELNGRIAIYPASPNDENYYFGIFYVIKDTANPYHWIDEKLHNEIKKLSSPKEEYEKFKQNNPEVVLWNQV